MNALKGAYYTDQYRNLLADYGYEEEEITRRVEAAWHEMFEGDEKTRIYHESGSDMGYMLDTGNHDARTEGMSYGMMMAVQMDRRDVFDRLWKWTVEYMYMTEGENAGYFAWSCAPDGTRLSDGPAPDGEEYFAMALFFASHRWGDRGAPFNYGEQARELLRTCLHKGEDGKGDPMWNRDNKLIKFIPNCEFTDPSYHLPHFYELFALWADPEDRAFWKEAAEASRRYVQAACHPLTGLAPEYAHYDGRPNHVRGFGHFFSDSYRVAANLGLDAEWFGGAAWERETADRIQAFLRIKRPTITAGIPLRGNLSRKKRSTRSACLPPTRWPRSPRRERLRAPAWNCFGTHRCGPEIAAITITVSISSPCLP
ncbi:hypothetical protein J25TS5_29240 [Paenibacillus faecis]|nr:hypothetical protein J25TS5_29240 [Paenibacillus faecis]